MEHWIELEEAPKTPPRYTSRRERSLSYQQHATIKDEHRPITVGWRKKCGCSTSCHCNCKDGEPTPQDIINLIPELPEQEWICTNCETHMQLRPNLEEHCFVCHQKCTQENKVVKGNTLETAKEIWEKEREKEKLGIIEEKKNLQLQYKQT